ncbi:5-carboxymethyl-2-hydroxymuconate isomerase [Parashewanella spongiae]|uniref:5-carboxymethyl-2-hydroxymuconate isomerase n=1 Tax=Parashewanella spongiae TaxID=342950 RepID=A0A3A6T3F6_9GAMM|nr:5-carboxymethyl-2-hydroxymuconate isomerase [Parashewanella spongiae]MCL1080219.1 5-carboxymethyl-2-hydroxymuconate isomerase [Parashewanella spongiae]RJY02114.1 5-carboxymethyl-2-hydroxymuconate isomerase [Parashewanella spongiae]
MPHCIIEHSDDFNSSILVEAVFKGALTSRLFESQDIKVRAQPFSHYQVGFKRSAFIHVTLRMMSGRGYEQKVNLVQSVVEQLKGLNYDEVSITTEIQEIDERTYCKQLV